jgi:hypothetical protein
VALACVEAVGGVSPENRTGCCQEAMVNPVSGGAP